MLLHVDDLNWGNKFAIKFKYYNFQRFQFVVAFLLSLLRCVWKICKIFPKKRISFFATNVPLLFVARRIVYEYRMRFTHTRACTIHRQNTILSCKLGPFSQTHEPKLPRLQTHLSGITLSLSVVKLLSLHGGSPLRHTIRRNKRKWHRNDLDFTAIPRFSNSQVRSNVWFERCKEPEITVYEEPRVSG